MSQTNKLKSAFVRLNRMTERARLRIQPVHYYSEVPNRPQLRRTSGDWNQPVALHQVAWDLDAQLAWLKATTADHIDEVRGLSAYKEFTDRGFGPGYGPIESQLLHCTIRREPPARIIEIGSGVSTAVMSEAVRRNERDDNPSTSITCIEPFPRAALKRLRVELLDKPAQRVDPAMFDSLGSGDLLFIDSTHAVHTGSEVPRIYLEILPRLRPGVRIHIHDIYLPYLFRPALLDDLWDWQETTLLAALLTSNPHLRVDACLSALFHERLAALRALLPDLRPRAMQGGLTASGSEGHFPTSIWLRSEA